MQDFGISDDKEIYYYKIYGTKCGSFDSNLFRKSINDTSAIAIQIE